MNADRVFAWVIAAGLYLQRSWRAPAGIDLDRLDAALRALGGPWMSVESGIAADLVLTRRQRGASVAVYAVRRGAGVDVDVQATVEQGCWSFLAVQALAVFMGVVRLVETGAWLSAVAATLVTWFVLTVVTGVVRRVGSGAEVRSQLAEVARVIDREVTRCATPAP